MKQKPTRGKGSELIVAGILIDAGLDVFLPIVDRGIDMVIQIENKLCSVQVKSNQGYNRIIGFGRLTDFLIIHYKHKGDKKDEFLYLTRDQVEEHWLFESEFKDVVLKKEDREKYKSQTIESLSERYQHSFLLP
jgi:hypothetical protein